MRIRQISGVIIVVCIFLFSGCGEKKSVAELYYCPMHPTYTSTKAGDCPICNMKLLLKKEPNEKVTPMSHAEHQKAIDPGAHADDAMPMNPSGQICVDHNCTMKDCTMHLLTKLTPGEKVSCPVCGDFITTENSTLVPLSTIEQPTTVVISPERQQLIGVKTETISERELFKEVRASGKVAYDPDIVIAQEEFVQAVKNRETMADSPLGEIRDRAQALVDAARNKLILLGLSDEQIAVLEKERRVDTSFYLPQGNSVWVYLSVYERDISTLQQGMMVDIEAVAYPGEIFHGAVKAINPVLDAMTRTNQMKVLVENTGQKLKPEMYVKGVIQVPLGKQIAVPKKAVVFTGLRSIVYVSREEGVIEVREVVLGPETEDYFVIENGIRVGDVVVVSGNFFIDSESKLQATMSSAGHTSH